MPVRITTEEELHSFDFKPEQIFQAGNCLIGIKLVDGELMVIDNEGYGGPINPESYSVLDMAIAGGFTIELIDNPTPVQRLNFAMNASEGAEAQKEGWGLFEFDGEIQLQRDDETKLFDSDDEAHDYVRKGANQGVRLHEKVRDFLKEYAPNEYNNIFN